MGTTQQRFFPVNTDQDQAFGPNVKKLEDAAGSVVSTTRAMHPSSVGTTTATLAPYTDQAPGADATVDRGWAFNVSGAEGMESGTHTNAPGTATGKRRIPVGTWSFLARFTIPTGGTLTGSHNVIVNWKVYRVATGGGARTLLFTATAPEESGNALGATNATATATFNAPEIVLEAGETIHVGITSTDRQAGGTLGATTAGTISFHTGGATDHYIEVAAPGVRSHYGPTLTPETLAATADLDRKLYMPRGLPETLRDNGATPTDAIARAIKTGRGLVEIITTSSTLERVYKSFRELSGSIPIGVEALARFFKGSRNNPETRLTTDTLAASFKGERSMTESVLTTDQAPERRFIGTRVLAAESIPTTHQVPDRVYRAQRALSETILTVDASLSRGYVGARNNAETIAIVDVIGRSIKQRRFLAEYPTGVTPDYAVTFPTKKIAGVVRDSAGAPYEGATVKLFRGQDDQLVAQTTSAADGSYEFLRDAFDPYTYWVGAYEETGEPTEGLTIRGLIPENV